MSTGNLEASFSGSSLKMLSRWIVTGLCCCACKSSNFSFQNVTTITFYMAYRNLFTTTCNWADFILYIYIYIYIYITITSTMAFYSSHTYFCKSFTTNDHPWTSLLRLSSTRVAAQISLIAPKTSLLTSLISLWTRPDGYFLHSHKVVAT